MRRRWAAIPGAMAATALSLAACVTSQVRLPLHPVPAGASVSVQAAALVLDPSDPKRIGVGDFHYAGGLIVTSTATSRLHGLSDLLVQPDGALLAVSDDGDRFTGKLVLDETGRLVGLTQATIQPLTGPVDEALQGKDWGDAEGVTRMAGGAIMVSFERHHRIWLYQAANDRRPVAEPIPSVAMANNDGMEGLAAAPTVGPDAYWVGVEPGTIWICHLKLSCTEVLGLPKPPAGYRLSSLTTGPNGELVILHHSYVAAVGSQIVVTIVRDPMGAKQIIGSFKMAPPLSVENFEGVSVVKHSDRWRLYLLSDDNFSDGQRTLLLAFDWTPPK